MDIGGLRSPYVGKSDQSPKYYSKTLRRDAYWNQGRHEVDPGCRELDTPKTYSITDAARMLGISRPTLVSLLERQRVPVEALPCIEIHSKVRYWTEETMAELLAWDKRRSHRHGRPKRHQTTGEVL